MRRLVLWIGLVAMLLTISVPAAARQPTELEELPRVERPSQGERAELSVVVRPGDFAIYWLELQRTTTRNGGTVVTATAETTESEGRTFAFGVAELRVPPSAFSAVLADILGFGTLIEGSLEGTDSGVSEIMVTITESATVLDGDSNLVSDSTLGRALDTAANVVLTILSVVIIVAAAVIPIGLLALFGYVVWRWTRTRFDPRVEVTRPAEDQVSEYVDSP